MKQISREIKITYRWWRNNGILQEHIPLLEEHAEERIHRMMKEGYVSGELVESIHDDNDHEVEYSGWWESTGSHL